MSSLASGRSLSPGKEDPARIWGLGLSGEGTALPGFLGPGQDRTLAVLLLPVTHVLNGHGNDKRPFSASVPSQTPPFHSDSTATSCPETLARVVVVMVIISLKSDHLFPSIELSSGLLHGERE